MLRFLLALFRGAHRSGSSTSALHLTLSPALGVALAAGTAIADVPSGARAFLAPSFTTAALTPPERRPPPCAQLDCVRQKLDSRSMVRLRGEFGSFEGRVMSWGPDSLVGFTAGSDWDGETPARPVAWSHVRRVDEREDGAMSGAIGGGLIGGLLFAVIGMMGESVAVAASWGTMEPSTERVLTATAIGVAVGALVGSAIGSSSKHWTPVYARP